MAGLKETRERIKSVKNTKKITYAMKLVSAAKLGKAQDAAKGFANYCRDLNSILTQALNEIDTQAVQQPLTEVREQIKKIGLIVIGANRGLCGPYNSSINKALSKFVKEQAGRPIEMLIIGTKPAEFCRNNSIEYQTNFTDFGDNVDGWDLERVLEQAISSFTAKSIDECYMLYTRYNSAISMQATVEKILPLDVLSAASATGVKNQAAPGTVLFEPSVTEVFSELLPRVLAAKLRKAALDSKAGEYASRMTAMDAATKNAGELVETLTLKYNKARQNAITADMLEIVGGAEAVKGS
jgi:F-type H+-transporting ATPase subunit gamma